MKSVEKMMCEMLVLTIMLATSFSANSVGFDAEKIYESVFVIYSGDSLGSGFAVGENCIVTNAHVVGDGENVTIATYSGKKYQAQVVGLDTGSDIAVLRISGAALPYLPVADISSMKTGDDVYAVGAPEGMTYTLTKGSVSAKERFIGTIPYIQIDAPINQGNSGGPLLNDSGEAIGMNSMKIYDSEGIGFAIPISKICWYLNSLGIALDQSGNVEGSVLAPERKETDSSLEMPDAGGGNNQPQHSFKVCVACGIANISLAGNILLIVLLINEKRKNLTLTQNPKERTDFEIDFWE